MPVGYIPLLRDHILTNLDQILYAAHNVHASKLNVPWLPVCLGLVSSLHLT